MGREAAGDRTDFSCLLKQPGERQCTGEHEMGVSPVWVDFNRLAQALDPANHSPEICIGKTDKEVPLKEERIARTESHRFFDMGAGLLGSPEQELHHADIGVAIARLPSRLMAKL